MDLNNQYQKYRAASVATLTPEELLIFLYGELSLNINRGILKIQKKSLSEAHNHIMKAQSIVQYLMDILDLSYPISNELLKLYDFLYSRLVQANIRKDEAILKEVLSMVTELKDTWQQAGEKIRRSSPPQE